MKLTRSLLLPSTLLAFVFITPVFADMDMTKQMMNSNDHIKNLDQVLTQVKKDTNQTPVFPAVIPKTSKSYYASSDATSQQNGFNYMINIDSTPDCNGAKYCNVGRVSAQKGTQPDLMKDKNNKQVTVPITLADGTQAFYTPGHAMGDYFPANVQWVDQNTIYMITWNGEPKSEKMMRAALITMANSAKNPGAG